MCIRDRNGFDAVHFFEYQGFAETHRQLQFVREARVLRRDGFKRRARVGADKRFEPRHRAIGRVDDQRRRRDTQNHNRVFRHAFVRGPQRREQIKQSARFRDGGFRFVFNRKTLQRPWSVTEKWLTCCTRNMGGGI